MELQITKGQFGTIESFNAVEENNITTTTFTLSPGDDFIFIHECVTRNKECIFTDDYALSRNLLKPLLEAVKIYDSQKEGDKQ